MYNALTAIEHLASICKTYTPPYTYAVQSLGIKRVYMVMPMKLQGSSVNELILL